MYTATMVCTHLLYKCVCVCVCVCVLWVKTKRSCVYVYYICAFVESRSYDKDGGYDAQIGNLRERGPTWPGTPTEGEGLILYDYCHHYCFVYGPSSWSSLAIINTYTTRPLTITVSLSHWPYSLYRRQPSIVSSIPLSKPLRRRIL